MLAERFRAYFSDFDAGGQDWSPVRQGIMPLARDDARAHYAVTAAIIGFIPTIFSIRVKL
jgi:hypothetical protein